MQAALVRPFALFKPEQLLIIASRETLSQNRGQPVDQPHAAERLSCVPGMLNSLEVKVLYPTRWR
jgi:hypothetical protein